MCWWQGLRVNCLARACGNAGACLPGRSASARLSALAVAAILCALQGTPGLPCTSSWQAHMRTVPGALAPTFLCMQEPSAAQPNEQSGLWQAMVFVNNGRCLPVIAELATSGMLEKLLQAGSRAVRRLGRQQVRAMLLGGCPASVLTRLHGVQDARLPLKANT